MLTEKEIIEIAGKEIPSGPQRVGACCSRDAEKVRFNAEYLLFSTDEFSGEDHFSGSNPYDLGWNIAAGAISDILAAGGVPLYYAQALVLTKSWNRKMLEKYCHGTRDVLAHYGMTFIGGDTGMAEIFRCTASVIGRASERDLSRKNASASELIYLSGRIGAGNFNAALSLFGEDKHFRALRGMAGLKFNLLNQSAPVIRQFATSCIDTSDGVFNALNTIAEVNRTGYAVDDLPYINKGKAMATMVALPRVLMFLGECGEYELMFTVKPGDETALLEEAQKNKLRFHRIGRITGDPAERTLNERQRIVDLTGLEIRARSFASHKDYLTAMITLVEKWETG